MTKLDKLGNAAKENNDGTEKRQIFTSFVLFAWSVSHQLGGETSRLLRLLSLSELQRFILNATLAMLHL